MKRVLALVAAVMMVGGAFVIRSQVIDSPDNPKSGPNQPAGGSQVTIGCAPELTNVCDAVASKDIKVFADPVDIANAAATASKVDAWLTYGPAPGIVNASTSDQATVFDNGTVVGTSRLGVVIPANRAAALTKRCAVAKLTWKCLTQNAGLPWSTVAPGGSLGGTVKVGVGDPSSALGTISTGPLALSTADRADPGIDDIDTNAVARVVASVDQQPAADELSAQTLQGPAAFSAVVALDGPAQRAATSTRGQGLDLEVIYPGPVTRTVVVLAPPAGRQVPQVLLDSFTQPKVRAAVTEAGWTPGTRGTTTGLPAPDVLYALRKVISP